MIIRNKVGKYKVNIILRHQGDKIDREAPIDNKKWVEKKLGIWWKPYTNTINKFTSKNKKEVTPITIGKGLMFGLNLIWANIWFDISKSKK